MTKKIHIKIELVTGLAYTHTIEPFGYEIQWLDNVVQIKRSGSDKIHSYPYSNILKVTETHVQE